MKKKNYVYSQIEEVDLDDLYVSEQKNQSSLLLRSYALIPMGDGGGCPAAASDGSGSQIDGTGPYC